MRTERGTRLIAASVVALLLVLVTGCAKGQPSGAATPKSGKPAAAAGMPVYRVSASKFTFHGMPAQVPAGKPFQISFTNAESFAITHELVVVQVPNGKSAKDIAADAKKKGANGEPDWLHFGEIADVDTGATGVGTFDLPAGNYALTCWQTGKAGGGTGPAHASIGMVKPFTAAATTAPAGTAPPLYRVSASKFTFHGMPARVPAGKPFQISFTNAESFAITHELVVIKVPNGKSKADIAADAKKKGAKGEPDWLHFGEIGDVDTGATGVGTFDLPAGNYALTCWQTGKAGGGTGPVHASIGMVLPFTASASAPAPASTAPAVYRVSASKFTFHGMPARVPAGKPFQISFTNAESFAITHELVVIKVPSGKTKADVAADAKKKGAKGEPDWLHFGEIGDVDTGATGVGTFDLPAGNYALTCWQTGKAGGGNGPVHASIGMVLPFTVA